jgi:hypothetical protein
MIGHRREPAPPVTPDPPVPEWSPALAVARGAGLLDRKMQHWRRKVNAEALSVSSVRSCVLAQVYGSYEAGIKELGLSRAEAVSYGFIWRAGHWDDDAERAALDEAWRAQVTGGGQP